MDVLMLADVNDCDPNPDPEVDPWVIFTCPQAKDIVDKAHSKVAFQHDRGGHVNRLLCLIS
jgi:hypothetical protein